MNNSSYLTGLLEQYLLPKRALTALAGCLANNKNPYVKQALINYFIRRFDINLQEVQEEDPHQYACFNDFFTRHLKPSCRPIANTEVVSPVDGFVGEIGQIAAGQLLQAKGRHYSVDDLLGGYSSEAFNQGLFATLYLSPKDYHRVHMPLDASLQEMTYIPGKLCSVRTSATHLIPRLFASNERVAVFFDTAFGQIAMVLVGATLVGKIGLSWCGDLKRGNRRRHYSYENENIQLAKAAEMGYFKMGSTVIVLFADSTRLQWAPHVQVGNSIRYGEALALA